MKILENTTQVSLKNIHNDIKHIYEEQEVLKKSMYTQTDSINNSERIFKIVFKNLYKSISHLLMNLLMNQYIMIYKTKYLLVMKKHINHKYFYLLEYICFYCMLK